MKTPISTHQHGFSIVEALLIVIVIALAGTLGWVAYSKFVAKTNNNATIVQIEKNGVADLAKPVEITTNDDIEKVSQDIDAVSIDDDSTLSEAEDAINDLD